MDGIKAVFSSTAGAFTCRVYGKIRTDGSYGLKRYNYLVKITSRKNRVYYYGDTVETIDFNIFDRIKGTMLIGDDWKKADIPEYRKEYQRDYSTSYGMKFKYVKVDQYIL
mgnify:CR=1 FL=1